MTGAFTSGSAISLAPLLPLPVIALLAAVSLPNGTAADAWSTALLVSGEAGVAALGQVGESARSLLLLPDDSSGFLTLNDGFDLQKR